MAIQMRRGVYADFDPSKLVEGEIAFVLGGDEASHDGKSVYVCFGNGNVKRFSTYDDMVYEIGEKIDSDFDSILANMTRNVNAAVTSANNSAARADGATANANTATANANTAKVDAENAASEARAAADRANSAAQGNKIKATVTFTSTGWSGTAPYTQTVTNANLANKSERDFVVALNIADNETPSNVVNQKKDFSYVDKFYSSTTGIVAICYSKKPAGNFSVNVREI